MLRRVIWMGAALVLAGALYAALYLEFVEDIRMPFSLRTMRGAFATHNKLPPEMLAATTAALKAKFGEATEVWQGPTAINARLNGEIVATAPAHTFFHEALGITQITGADGTVSTFPFDISPYELRSNILTATLPILKMEVEHAFPDDKLDFGIDDFSVEQCRSLSARELQFGFTGQLLRFGPSTLCTIVWKRTSRRMLIGIVAARGGSWIRPFVRHVCGSLSNKWLANERGVNATQQPDYLQCLIADRPENNPSGSGVASFVYEIRKDGSLAAITDTPQAAFIRPLRPNPNMPKFHRVTPGEPEPEEPPRKIDAERNDLRNALVEAANRLIDAPCDEAAKARYIKAAADYAHSWIKLLPCLERDHCDPALRENLERTVGTPWQLDAMNAAEKAHQTATIQASDFPKDVLVFMASMASDPSINPQADIRSTFPFPREDCTASDRH